MIVRIEGGLGNQMFQYALYKSLESKGKDVKLDVTSFYNENKNHHNGYELERIFNLNPNIASKDEIRYLSDFNKDIASRVKRKLIGRKKSHFKEEKKYRLDKRVFNFENKYLEGYWQSRLYFEDISAELRKDFTIRKPLDKENLDIVKKIENTNSVSIHIRRGDYIASEYNINTYGGVATLDYYNKAIEFINNKVDNCTFFVFSNDIQWVKENIKSDNKIYYIDNNSGYDSYKDMELMRKCKHNIIANSTFSWWSAWLNENDNKIVIAPKKWVNSKNINSSEIELFEDNWILF